MGLFGKKEAKAPVETEVIAQKKQTPQRATAHYTEGAIVRPRVTEKSALLIDKNVYTFEIKKGATKYEVRDAVKSLFKVTPVSVHIVNRPARKSLSATRGRRVTQSGLRKAYVYLKEGDRIDLV